MPGFDGTGPMGHGPMTGGARGFCRPGAAGRLFAGRGFRGSARGFGLGRGGWPWGGGRGRGFGGGRGFGNWKSYGLRPRYMGFGPVPQTAVSEPGLEDLKQYAADLEQELRDVSSRLSELEKKGEGA